MSASWDEENEGWECEEEKEMGQEGDLDIRCEHFHINFDIYNSLGLGP